MNRALFIGINNYPTAPLEGCVNDVTDMASYLTSACGFLNSDIRLVVDERATTDAIKERLNWLVSGVRQGDRILFHFSGHGAQMVFRSGVGDVVSQEEAICPFDFDWTEGHAIGAGYFKSLFSSLPGGNEFIWISDSCYSGGLVRELMKVSNRRVKCMPMPADMAWRLNTARSLQVTPRTLNDSVQHIQGTLVAACDSDQEASDAVFDDRPNGALTYFLIRQLKSQTGQTDTLQQIVTKTATDLSDNHFSQQPQLEGALSAMGRPFLSI